MPYVPADKKMAEKHAMNIHAVGAYIHHALGRKPTNYELGKALKLGGSTISEHRSMNKNPSTFSVRKVERLKGAIMELDDEQLRQLVLAGWKGMGKAEQELVEDSPAQEPDEVVHHNEKDIGQLLNEIDNDLSTLIWKVADLRDNGHVFVAEKARWLHKDLLNTYTTYFHAGADDA